MKKKELTNIIFYGIGGQGILTASEICGWAAVFAGYHVKKSEVHGMAQRGGSVESHLRFGKEVFSPLVPEGEADILLCLYTGEHSRFTHFLKPGGIDLIEYLRKAEKDINDSRHVNTYMLGVLSKHVDIDEGCWLKAFEKVLKPKYVEENIKIFKHGRSAVN